MFGLLKRFHGLLVPINRHGPLKINAGFPDSDEAIEGSAFNSRVRSVVKAASEFNVAVIADRDDSNGFIAVTLVGQVEPVHVGGFMKIGHHHFAHGHVGDRDVFSGFNRAPGFEVLDRFEYKRVLSRACTTHKRRR